MIDAHYVIPGTLLNLAGSATYVRDTIRGSTRPNRATFFLWSLAPLIAFAAEIRDGTGLAAVATLGTGLAPMAILLASFVNRTSVWRLGPFDYFCGVLSVAALVLWRVTGSGDVAVLFSLLADFFAGLPTLVKAFRHPHTETGSAYLMGGISALIGVAAASSWTFINIAFPLYIAIVCAVLWLLVVVPRPGDAPVAEQPAC